MKIFSLDDPVEYSMEEIELLKPKYGVEHQCWGNMEIQAFLEGLLKTNIKNTLKKLSLRD